MASQFVTIALRDEKPRLSPSKYLQRRLIRAWKSMTRKNQCASILAEDFVILTNRRRSIFLS
ncbi:hypothetical protein K474DRAFT_1660057 [Panus rudis PR-1116 ss-1]|nr:hypothetical protein K474DRAFT_1660057 [Panus rudis PR-1116 ss-1]